MYSRALRLFCALVAVIATGAAAFLLVRAEQHISQQTASLNDFDQHARDTTAALVDARVGQQAYVAAGQGVAFWFGKTGGSIQAASAGLAALRQQAGAASATAIDETIAIVSEFAAIDKRARDYLKSGQQLMAGDVIFTEGSDAAATAVRQIETARQAQHQEVLADIATVRRQQMLIAGTAVGVALLVVLLLIPVPRAAVAASSPVAGLSLSVPPPVEMPAAAPKPVAPAGRHAQASVFKAATDVATDFGRVRDLEDLTRVLGRAAEVMDASGMMVWVGNASRSELRPALAHGYSEEMIARLPPVARTADNAAAAAYRSGALQIALSRPGGASGAVVAPILAPDGCIGALSAEIRSGGETSESVQALAVIFAAHLAGVLAIPQATADVERRAANS